MNCWAQAFTASIVVALVVIAIFALIFWSVVNYIRSYIASVASKVMSFSSVLIRYFTALIAYLVDQSLPNLDNLKKEIQNLIDMINEYYKLGVKKVEQLVELFNSKIDAYVAGDRRLLTELNSKISSILGRDLNNALNKLDTYVLSKPSNTNMLHHTIENLNILLTE